MTTTDRMATLIAFLLIFYFVLTAAEVFAFTFIL
jgi:hypothetical protein